MKLTLAVIIVLGMGQLALAQTAPNPPQGQHLTKKHRTKVVTGKPLFSAPDEKKSTLVTYTPEDMRELFVATHDVEVITLQKSNSIQ